MLRHCAMLLITHLALQTPATAGFGEATSAPVVASRIPVIVDEATVDECAFERFAINGFVCTIDNPRPIEAHILNSSNFEFSDTLALPATNRFHETARAVVIISADAKRLRIEVRAKLEEFLRGRVTMVEITSRDEAVGLIKTVLTKRPRGVIAGEVIVQTVPRTK